MEERLEGRIRSHDRGTRKFQITGVKDEVYDAFTIISLREERSLNATLRLAVQYYLERFYPAVLEQLNEGVPLDRVSVLPSVPQEAHAAEVAKQIEEVRQEVAPRAPRPTAGSRGNAQSNKPQAPYQRKSWNPIVKWPGPVPTSPEALEWEAAGRPDYPEWDEMKKAKAAAAASE